MENEKFIIHYSLFFIHYFRQRRTSLGLALFIQICMSTIAKVFLTLVMSIASLSAVLNAPTVLATNACDTSADLLGLDCVEGSGLSAQDPRTIVTRIINVALGLLGIVATVLIVYAGFLWMTAGGNDDQVSKAKSILSASIIGLVIILSAYSISRFVLSRLYSATTGNPYDAQILP